MSGVVASQLYLDGTKCDGSTYVLHPGYKSIAEISDMLSESDGRFSKKPFILSWLKSTGLIFLSTLLDIGLHNHGS
jgi:hypothetical protein